MTANRIGLDATGQPGNGLRNTEGAIADDGFRTEIRDNAAAAEDPEGG